MTDQLIADSILPLSNHFKQRLRSARTLQSIGKVAGANGVLIKVSGLTASIGELCYLYNPHNDWSMDAEVVGLLDPYILLTPMGELHGLSSKTHVIARGEYRTVGVGDALLGRVLDARGQALDEVANPECHHKVPLYNSPPGPMQRRPIETVMRTGVRAIDSLLTCGMGQRLGIFAVAGGGKSSLLGMLAEGSQADINVIVLIGERGREVGEFVRDHLGDSLSKSVIIAATSDRPALERASALYVATSIAEYFRDQGKNVLLLADSITRYARALRDIGLAAGEPPTRRGFPPSVFSTLPKALERAGNNHLGSITAFYTVLMEDEDSADPIAEEVQSILDGHMYLSRKLAGANHYPAIDVLDSVSRLATKLIDKSHADAAARARQLLAKYREIELLLQMGEYQAGQDGEADAAVNCAPALRKHLAQKQDEHILLADSLQSLRKALSGLNPL